MTFPIVALTEGFCGQIHFGGNREAKLGDKLALPLMSIDALVWITALVIGIVGLCGHIHGMPPAAGWALVGTSCGITVGWLVLGLAILYQISKEPKEPEYLIE